MAPSAEASAPEPDAIELATDAMHRAASQAGVDSAGAELVRHGSNVVFQLPASRVIARVSPAAGAMGDVARQVAVARWLESVDYPATRALPVDQPIVMAGRICTFWRSASPTETYADIGDVARVIRELHQLQAPGSLGLPAYDPFPQAYERLRMATAAPADAVGYLRTALDKHRASYNGLEFKLPAGVIHGDANVGNVILDDNGAPVVIDLDSFAVGPREWDLIQTALFADRLGWHTEEEYRRFVEVYGYDVRRWSGYEQLADLREVLMTTWLAAKARDAPRNVEETERRVDAMRSGGSRRDWNPN